MIRVYLWGAVLAAVLAGIGSVWFLGGQAARDKAERDTLQGDKATNERINDADVSQGDTAADRDWLSDRGRKRDLQAD